MSSKLDIFVTQVRALLMVPKIKIRKGLPKSLGVLTLISSSQENDDNRTTEN